jgi:hypothetical protein
MLPVLLRWKSTELLRIFLLLIFFGENSLSLLFLAPFIGVKIPVVALDSHFLSLSIYGSNLGDVLLLYFASLPILEPLVETFLGDTKNKGFEILLIGLVVAFLSPRNILISPCLSIKSSLNFLSV